MKASTTISIDEQLLQKARDIAARQRRNFSAQVEKWIEEKLEEENSVESLPTKPEEATA